MEGTKGVDTGVRNQEESGKNDDIAIQPDMDGRKGEGEFLPEREGEEEAGGVERDRQENSDPEWQEEQKQEVENNAEPQIPGQDNIMYHPEYLPSGMQQEEEPGQHDIEVVENTTPTTAEYMKEAGYLSDRVFQTLFYWNGESISVERVELVKEHLEQLVTICNQLLDTAEDGWIKAD